MDIHHPVGEWALDPQGVHLNHGSYGGITRAMFARAAELHARLEAAPMKFFVLDWQGLIDEARAAVAEFVHAPVADTVFVPSATTGVAIAIHSCEVGPGDDIVTTDHSYRAVKNQLLRRGGNVITVPLALPFEPDAFVASILAAITPRTRLVVLDHVTSATAIVFPLERIVPQLVARGIQVVIDGAHAPGQIELDVGKLGATFYTGNHHKWLCAPKASGFLVGKTARPIVTSHGASPEYGPANRLHAELDWSGTYDPTSQLCAPLFTQQTREVRERNHALALAFADAIGGRRLAPDSSLGAMVAMPLKLRPGVDPLAIREQLLRDNWEVMLVDWRGQQLLRVSTHLYNSLEDAPRLLAKLHQLGVSL
ncbi:MAG TPA: aminotransferase class V-fold PLP-dependent enzyme [Kofleriaceae bacterium]